MIDQGAAYTDKELAKMEKKIKQIYSEAQSDIEDKIAEFNKKFAAKSEMLLKQVDEGKITQEQYDQWLRGQVFQSEQWESKKDQIIGVIQNANKEAANILNGGTISVFAENANWSHYQMEQSQGVNFGFGLYDAQTVTNLIKNDPQVLPKWKINEPKDYIWNAKKVNNSITQGTIQGEGLDKIAKRLANSLSSNNKNTMLTFARTAMTGAQNAGRYQSQQDAKELGIDIVKVWMSTLDKHTRVSHQELDGEEQKVGDKWHPFKFSNGCRYPGDPQGPPHEVYNCRCTLVSDIKDYPSKFNRYDNIDGKPIKNMSYKEWKEAKKSGTELKPWVPLVESGTPVGLTVGQPADNGWKKAKTTGGDMTPHNFEDPLLKAQNELKLLQEEVINKGADKVFSNIWYDQDVTYADWKNKKGSIQAKKDYYNKKIAKHEQAGTYIDMVMVNELKDELADLEEFEKNGKEYSKLLQKLKDAKQKVKNLKLKSHNPFGPDAYSQSRKDGAWWARSPQEADKNLREVCGEVWRDATAKERDAIYEYTRSYHKFNEPLRGYEYGTSRYLGVGNTDLNASYANNGKRLNDMTSIIDKSWYDHDMWLQRGCKFDGMDKFLQCDMNLLQNGSQEELENELMGKVITEYGFMSCGSSKGQGFSGNVMLNVYAPAGTKMMYAEPFSKFGEGDGKKWDGVNKQSSLGNELETILQQGTQFRITKVDKSGDKIWLDIEVIDQSNVQLWK